MVWDTAQRITFSRHSNKTRIVYSVIVVAVVVVFASCVMLMIPSLAGVTAGRVFSQQLVIIDTDPGIDDAVAILATLGDPNVKVLAITCVRGNTDVPNVVTNALKILMVARNYEVPVYSGHNFGLMDSPDSGDWFGTDGLGDLPFPNPLSPPSAQQEHAASFLARIVREYPGEITVLAIGPLTNIALALHLNPQFLQLTRRLIVLGGSIRGHGNAAPGVEFNFYMDPDAATLVLDRASSSGTLVTLMAMEPCSEENLTKEWRWNSLGKLNNSVVSFLNNLETKELQMHPSPYYHPFDLYAVAITLSPEFVTHSQEFYGYVENRGRRSQGALFVDYMNLTRNSPNLEVIMEVNITVIKKKVMENFSNFK